MSSQDRYVEDLARLGEALARAVDWIDDDQIERVREILLGRELVAVAAGGAGPVATLAAQTHIDTTGRSARSLSPLLFLQEDTPPPDEAVLLFSAQARHRDTVAVAAAARRTGRSVVLITQRSVNELGDAFRDVVVVQIPTIAGRDGFLATKSLMSMSGAVWKIYESAAPWEPLSIGHMEQWHDYKPRLLVCFGRNERAAAEDIEVRFSELGLADVQLADYRSVAHGRHLGLSRHLSDTTLIALVGPQSGMIAERTLRTMPTTLDIVKLSTLREGLAGRIEILAAVASLPVGYAESQGVSPTKPSVPLFGRKLYHLTSGRGSQVPTLGPVARKLSAMEIRLTTGPARSLVAEAYVSWRKDAARQRFDTIVSDYDGTLVSTIGRYDLPPPDLRARLTELLDQGMQLVIASGRGDSLRESLETWLPSEFHAQVRLGLHNGSWLTGLGINRMPEPATDALGTARRPLEMLGQELGQDVRVRSGQSQITFSSRSLGLSMDAIRNLSQARIDSLGLGDQVRVVSSAHSVDIISGAGKRATLGDVTRERTLLIGDQGQLGGNDFELLGASRWSVSVDKVSTSLDRCWAVSPLPPGPQSTLWILSHLTPKPDGFKLTLPAAND